MYENEISFRVFCFIFTNFLHCTETLYKSKGLHSVIFFETEKYYKICLLEF